MNPASFLNGSPGTSISSGPAESFADGEFGARYDSPFVVTGGGAAGLPVIIGLGLVAWLLLSALKK